MSSPCMVCGNGDPGSGNHTVVNEHGHEVGHICHYHASTPPDEWHHLDLAADRLSTWQSMVCLADLAWQVTLCIVGLTGLMLLNLVPFRASAAAQVRRMMARER